MSSASSTLRQIIARHGDLASGPGVVVEGHREVLRDVAANPRRTQSQERECYAREGLRHILLTSGSLHPSTRARWLAEVDDYLELLAGLEPLGITLEERRALVARGLTRRATAVLVADGGLDDEIETILERATGEAQIRAMARLGPRRFGDRGLEWLRGALRWHARGCFDGVVEVLGAGREYQEVALEVGTATAWRALASTRGLDPDVATLLANGALDERATMPSVLARLFENPDAGDEARALVWERFQRGATRVGRPLRPLPAARGRRWGLGGPVREGESEGDDAGEGTPETVEWDHVEDLWESPLSEIRHYLSAEPEAAIIVARLSERLGEEAAGWIRLVALADSWQGSLHELAETVRVLDDVAAGSAVPG